MPGEIINIQCEQRLVRFLESYFKSSPVRFPRGHHFNNILEILLDFPPLDYRPVDHQENTLSIEIPSFELKDPRSYNYLSPVKQRVFENHIRKFFYMDFRSEISDMILKCLDRKEAIEIYIEKHNLSFDCWDALEKDFGRFKAIRRRRKHKLRKKSVVEN